MVASDQVNGSCGAHDDLATIIIASVGGSSAIVCMLDIAVVFAFGFHTQLVYRLALYQVFSSLAFGLSCVLQLTYMSYSKDLNVYGKVCVCVGWLTQVTCCLKLFFSAWMTFHLFLYAVCYSNAKKLEPWFVAGVILLSLLLSAVPFTTHSYGPSGSWCWIQNLEGNCSIQLAGVAEQFVLWYGLAFLVLLVQCVAISVMVVILAARLYKSNRYQLVSNSFSQQYYNLLKRLLPLVTYPLLFTLLVTPPFINRLYEAIRHSDNRGLLLANACIAPTWSLAAGLTLMVHVTYVLCSKGRASSVASSVEREGSITANVSESYNTFFVVPSSESRNCE